MIEFDTQNTFQVMQMEPNNLDIKGRPLSEEERKKLYQYFNKMDYLTDTIHIVEANIAEANDTEAASIWVQWLLNAALGSFDRIVKPEEDLHD